MWALDRAKMDSDLPSCARSTLVSRTTHGSGLERSGFRINSRIHELGKVLHDDIRSVRTQRIGLAGAVDADHQPKAPSPAGLDAGEGLFVDSRVSGQGLEHRGRAEVSVGSGLAGEVIALGEG